MPKFSRGERVYLRDGALTTLERHGRERLGVVLGEAGPDARHGNGRQGHVTYLVEVRGVEDPTAEMSSPVPQELLEPAGSLGERYEQVIGPFSDFEAMLKEAVSLNQRFVHLRDIDLIVMTWPQWMPVVEIRDSRIDVPVLHTGSVWAWHMGMLLR